MDLDETLGQVQGPRVDFTLLIYWHTFLYDEVHLIFIDCTI